MKKMKVWSTVLATGVALTTLLALAVQIPTTGFFI